MPPAKSEVPSDTCKTPRRRRRLPKTSSEVSDKENSVDKSVHQASASCAEVKSRSRRPRKGSLIEDNDSINFRSPSSKDNLALKRFERAQKLLPSTDIWTRYPSLAECVVLASQGLHQAQGVLLLEEHSVELLNFFRKCLKEATSEGKDKFSCLYVAIHGLRALCPLITKSSSWDAALKLLYHAVVTSAEMFTPSQKNKTWDSAVMCLAAFQALGQLLANHTMKNDSQKQISLKFQSSSPRCYADVFPLPSIEKMASSSLKGTIPATQIFKISIQSSVAVGNVLSKIAVSSTSSASEKDSCREFGISLGDLILQDRKERPFVNCLRIVRDIALPWTTFLVRAEGEESFEDALFYAKRAHRLLWDAAALLDKQKLPSEESIRMSLKLRKYSLFAILLHHGKGSPSSIRSILRKKYMEHACTCAWKTAASYSQRNTIKIPVQDDGNDGDGGGGGLYDFHVSVGDVLDLFAKGLSKEEQCTPYVEYCSYRIIHLGVQQKDSNQQERYCQRDDCMFASVVPSYTHRRCLRDPGSVALGLILLAQTARQEIDSLLKSNGRQCSIDSIELENRGDNIIARFRSLFFASNATLSADLRLRYHKLLSLLSLHRLAFVVQKEIVAVEDIERQRALLPLLKLVGRFLSECVGPLAISLVTDDSNDSLTAQKTQAQLLEVSAEYFMIAASLFDRLHSSFDCEWSDTCSKDKVLASLADKAMVDLYRFVTDLSDGQSRNRPLMLNLKEKTAKTLAGIGKRRFDRQELQEALLPLVFSTNIFVQVSSEQDNSGDRGILQISARFAHISSICHTLGMFDHACLALLAAILYESLDQLGSPKACDMSLGPLESIGRFTNGVFLVGDLPDNGSDPRRAFVSRLISTYMERRMSPDIQQQSQCSPASPPFSPSCISLGDFLAATIEDHAYTGNLLGDINLSDLLQAALMGSGARKEFIVHDENNVASSRLQVVLEALNHIGTDIQRASQTESQSHLTTLLDEFDGILQIATSIIDGGSDVKCAVNAAQTATVYLAAATSLVSSFYSQAFYSFSNGRFGKNNAEHRQSLQDAETDLFNRSLNLATSARDYLSYRPNAIDSEINQFLFLFLQSSLDMFCLELSELKYNGGESRISPAVILSLCAKGTALISTISERCDCDSKSLEALASNFSRNLMRLEVNFIAKGDKLHAAQFSNVNLRLAGNSSTEERLWHGASVASSLMDSGLCSLAQKVLNKFEPLRINAEREVTTLKSFSTRQILEMELAAVALRLHAQSCSGDELSDVNVVENYLTVLSDDSSKLNRLLWWVACTCNMALSDASERKGDVAACLQYLQKSFRICQKALSSRERSKERVVHSGFDTILQSLQVRFSERRVVCLRRMALCYTRLGDYRKSNSHILSAADLSELHLSARKGRTKFGEVLPSVVTPVRTVQQLGCYRALLEMKGMASAADVVGYDLAAEISPGILYIPHGIAAAQDGCSLPWDVEEIWNLVTHGDLLFSGSQIPQDNEYARIYESATQLAGRTLAQPLVHSYLAPLASCQSMLDRAQFLNFTSLSCHLKLREARSLMRDEQFGALEEKAKSLCLEITQLAYAPTHCRAWAFYYLGLSELELSRESGALNSLWRHHSIVPHTAEEQNESTVHEKEDYQSLRRARHFFKEALLHLGPPSELLARDAMRSLALVSGPEENSNRFDESCAVLVHASIGSTARQAVSRAYVSDQPPLRHLQDLNTQLRDIFEALDANMGNAADRTRKVNYLFREANRLFPPCWRFVAATICPTGEILLTSASPSTSSTHPKMSSVCVFPGNGKWEVHEKLLVPLDNLIRRSQDQLHGLSASAAAEQFGESKSKRNWWKERESIDDQIKALIKDVEKKYFGAECIKRLFTGCDVANHYNATTSGIEEDTSFDNSSDSSDFSCGNLASNFEAACTIDPDSSCRQQNDVSAKEQSCDRAKLEKMKVAELKTELINLSVPYSGMRKLRKAELIDLLISLKLQASAPPDQGTEKKKRTTNDPNSVRVQSNNENDCLFLILDEHLQRFPFEGMSFMVEKAVSRIPSLPFAVAVLLEAENVSPNYAPNDSENLTINPVEASFVVDPEANLEDTNKRLIPAINDMDSINGWNWKGVVGRMPSTEFIVEAMVRPKGLFLYCGHGGGQSFFSRNQVEKLLHGDDFKLDNDVKAPNSKKRRCRSSIILMGCSSGKLESVNCKGSNAPDKVPIFYEPEGIVISYLCAGAPCVVGNLWDVTDRDIDRYCLELLRNFLTSDQRVSLAQCVANARSACKMRYIVGCAPVCYGVPVYVKRGLQ